MGAGGLTVKQVLPRGALGGREAGGGACALLPPRRRCEQHQHRRPHGQRRGPDRRRRLFERSSSTSTTEAHVHRRALPQAGAGRGSCTAKAGWGGAAAFGAELRTHRAPSCMGQRRGEQKLAIIDEWIGLDFMPSCLTGSRRRQPTGTVFQTSSAAQHWQYYGRSQIPWLVPRGGRRVAAGLRRQHPHTNREKFADRRLQPVRKKGAGPKCSPGRARVGGGRARRQ